MPRAPSPPLRLERSLPWAVAALVFALALFELTRIDLQVQDLLFDASRGAWRIDGRDPLWRALFYVGPKFALIVFGVGVFVAALASARWREKLGVARYTRRSLLALGLTLATVPALVGALKAATNVFCPSEITRYGGDICYVKLWERYPPNEQPRQRGRCFPAGHASGGFALVALAGVASTRRGQLTALAAAAAVGVAMGGYQMAKGAHYLSHTAVTALTAWIVFVSWRWLLAHSRAAFLSAP